MYLYKKNVINTTLTQIRVIIFSIPTYIIVLV